MPDPVPDKNAEAALERLPFLAPCRHVGPGAPFRWLARGVKDMRSAPRQSLTWGLSVVLLSWVVGGLAWGFGSYMLVLSLVSGFVFIGPLLAMALYSMSWRLDRGRHPTFRRSVAEAQRQLGGSMVFTLVLIVIFLVWLRAASMVHVFFPVETGSGLRGLVTFFAVGSGIGLIFSAITFAASAFALPMMVDRKTDTVTAVVTSVNAVLRNKSAMAVWLGIIFVGLAVGFATGLVGMIVLFPLLGHTTWHSYKDVIDASEWPAQEPMGLP